MKPIQVGLLGIGTVGSGTFKVLQAQPGRDPAPRRPRHRDHAWSPTRTREGAQASRRRRASRSPTTATRWSTDPDIDIVIELIGGYERRASELVLEAIANGKHVVTANKALLARARQRDLRRGAGEGRDGRVRGRGRRRHPDHQGAARRADRQPHRMDRRHHQRHHQLHPVGDARQGARLRRPRWRRRRRSATPRPIRPSTSRASTPRTSSRSCRRSRSAFRCSSTRRTSRASRSCTRERHPLRRGARLPHQAARHHASARARASSCACIRRWFRRGA